MLFGNGINCEHETAYANKLAGFDADLMHIDEMMENPKRIRRYGFINFPGGFLDGDDLGSAKAQAVKWKYQTMEESGERFLDELVKFVLEGKIIIGICNGFQLLVKTGLLPALGKEYGKQTTTLTANDSGRFEDRWVYLKVNRFSHCIFTKDMDKIYLPVRHGEGKCVIDTPENRKEMNERGCVVMQYVTNQALLPIHTPTTRTVPRMLLRRSPTPRGEYSASCRTPKPLFTTRNTRDGRERRWGPKGTA